jgi:DNA (cytosine-5)-methyltransferase 1
MPGRTRSAYPALIGPVRQRLAAWGGPYVIENVPTAPLQGIILCGQMFGLGVYRHRRFESNVLLLAPWHLRHSKRLSNGRLGRYFRGGEPVVTVAGHMFNKAAGERAMGISWMTKDELAEAVPPAYGLWIGRQLIRYVEGSDG